MNRILQFLRGKSDLTVEAFGKLPFYQDYISLATSPEAMEWKTWLLQFAGKHQHQIPSGRWPFLFQNTKKSKFLIGLIEDSTDGIREFPFSLFCAVTQKRMNSVPGTWQALTTIRSNLDDLATIDTFYQRLRGKQIPLSVINKSPANIINFEPIVTDKHLCWPRLTVFQIGSKSQQHLTLTARTEIDLFMQKWQNLPLVSDDVIDN